MKINFTKIIMDIMREVKRNQKKREKAEREYIKRMRAEQSKPVFAPTKSQYEKLMATLKVGCVK